MFNALDYSKMIHPHGQHLTLKYDLIHHAIYYITNQKKTPHTQKGKFADFSPTPGHNYSLSFSVSFA